MTAIATSEIDQLRHLAANDLDVWASLCAPDISTYPWPDFYKEIFLVIAQGMLGLNEDNKLFKLLLGVPRGHAKTTFLKLVTSYGIVHRLFDFPLVVCSTGPNATNFMSDVDAMLSHSNITTLYGSWENAKRVDNSEFKRANYQGRSCIIAAASITSGVRGLAVDMKRPDFIICDDIQTREVAESKEQTAKVKRILVGTIFKLKSPHRCGIIYLGNRYPNNCILDMLLESGEFTNLVTGGILADKQALWPELHSIASLRAEFKMDVAIGEGATFMAEVMNSPMVTASYEPLFPDYDFPLTILPQDMEKMGAFITIDPAGRKKSSDDTVITGHIVYEFMKIEVALLDAGKMSPKETIARAIAMAHRISAKYIFVEAVGYQETLAYWANETCQQLHLADTLNFYPLTVGNQSKLSRIRAWAKEILDGSYIVTQEEVKAELLFQALQFNPTRTDNTDDKLDCAAAGVLVRNSHLNMVISSYSETLSSMAASAKTVAGGILPKLMKLYS